MESHESHLNLMKSIEIPDIHGNSWNPKKVHEIYRNYMKSIEIYEIDEIHGNSMKSIKSIEISWNPMQFLKLFETFWVFELATFCCDPSYCFAYDFLKIPKVQKVSVKSYVFMIVLLGFEISVPWLAFEETAWICLPPLVDLLMFFPGIHINHDSAT